MRASIALLLMTVSATAQTAFERIEPRLTTAIDEHRVFLTCSSLDPQLHASVLSGWQQIVAKARHYLESRYTSMAELATFDARTAEEHIVRAEAPLRDAVELCTKTAPEWQRKYTMFDFTIDIVESPQAK